MMDSISKFISILIKRNKSKKAFTMIELLVVFMVLGIICLSFFSMLTGLFDSYNSVRYNTYSVSSKMQLLAYLDNRVYCADSVVLSDGKLFIMNEKRGSEVLELSSDMVMESGATIYVTDNNVHLVFGEDEYEIKPSKRN